MGLRKKLYEEVNRLKKSKALKFAVGCSLADLLVTDIHMHLYEYATIWESNEIVRKLIADHGIEGGLAIGYLTLYLPSILAAYFSTRLIDSGVRKYFPKLTQMYAEDAILYCVGLNILFKGVYGWIKMYELNHLSIPYLALLLPTYLPYIFLLSYVLYGSNNVYREIKRIVKDSK